MNRELRIWTEDQYWPSAAWISPEGTVYPCHRCEHFTTAQIITRELFGNTKGESYLEDLGWGRLYYTGQFVVEPNYGVATEAQLNTLEKFRDKVPETDFYYTLGRVLGYIRRFQELKAANEPFREEHDYIV